MVIVGNPASRSIIPAARLAYRQAGLSVQGMLPHWRIVAPDPGKSVFWRDALEECGVDANVAYRTVEDLNRAHRSW